MFNIGLPELIIIFGVAILVVGPKKLPNLAKTLGKGMREFRKASSEFKDSLYQLETHTPEEPEIEEPEKEEAKTEETQKPEEAYVRPNADEQPAES
ncbi:twin-arginine translocase TatA/TatE family subunit [Bdellovibrionota bacterium]